MSTSDLGGGLCSVYVCVCGIKQRSLQCCYQRRRRRTKRVATCVRCVSHPLQDDRVIRTRDVGLRPSYQDFDLHQGELRIGPILTHAPALHINCNWPSPVFIPLK